MGEKEFGLTTRPNGSWIQTERAEHELWAVMISDEPKVAALLHVLLSQMGRHNAIVASQKTLARLARCSVRTLQRSLAVLTEGNWIETRQLGPTGTVLAYVVNSRVAWSGPRDGIRYSVFSADVLIADDEQPDAAELDALPPLQRIPSLNLGEKQLPSGPGLPPISSPSLPGLEPDLPSKRRR